ncbi:MAG TPA: hypothetical protein VLT47_00780 [Anaeromyxobacteraceae bacterium]|nr:hypothetical protein [Anaeromyxobacteraceae bacterium]
MTLQDELRFAQAGKRVSRPPRRWDLVAAWALILAPLVGLAIWLGLRQRVGDLEERLVRDANAAFSRTFERPVHADAPLPGTLGDAVARHLPPIQAWADSVKDDEPARDVAREIVEGKRPLARLPAAYARALADLAPHLDGLLAGTRAAKADLPSGREAFVPCDGANWTGYQAAALLVGLRARRSLAAADAAGAVALCLDGLALGRDAAITSGMVGHMAGAAIVKRLAPPCRDALARLSPPERRTAASRLRVVRDGFPSVHEMLRVEFLSVELTAFTRLFHGDARRRLHEGALAVARSATWERPGLGAWWERWIARDGWRALRATMDAALALAGSARGEALGLGLDELGKESIRRINPLAAIAMPNYAKYVGRAEEAVGTLDALINGAPTNAR